MKFVVVGLGSMGKRRIRLMKQYDNTLDIIGVDSNIQRVEQVRKELQIQTVQFLEDVYQMEGITGAFVCTSPLSHHSIIKQLISNGIHVFTEINLVSDGYETFVSQHDVKLFLSSTFLYRKDVQWMIEKVRGRKVNYIYHTGQYLPDWHPWESYKHFFVDNVKTNGCREILAIELPWIVACFGKVKSVSVLKDKMSGLQIDYPDNLLIQMEHENGNKGILAVDVVARKAMRRIEIYNEELQIFWNGTPNSLQEFNIAIGELVTINTYESVMKDNNYCENIIENAYMDEIDAFITWIKYDDKSKVKHSFSQDWEILKLIDKIEGN